MVKIKVICTMYKILQTSATGLQEKQAVEDPTRIGRSFFILETKLLLKPKGFQDTLFWN